MSIPGQGVGAESDLRPVFRLTDSKVRVKQVIDGRTIVIDNGETVVLPMLYIPVERDGSPGEAMAAAHTYLKDTLQDRFVRLYQVRDERRGQTDAMGRRLVFIERDDGMWIQEDMAAKGFAFVYPTEVHFEMADRLYMAEQAARQAGTGLWADPRWAVVSDTEAKSLSDRFAIVEGRVEKIVTRNNTIYVNFERDWKTDFTVAVDASRRRDFSKAGISPMQWAGKTIRVRGWLRQYNGPFMDIFHPSQVEIIDKSGTGDSGEDGDGLS